MATITGQRARSTSPAADTPDFITAGPDGLPCTGAEAAWRAITLSIAATPHVRVSWDGGRTFPARRARPLPVVPPSQPCTIPVYDPGSASGRLLALDLDPARGDVDHQGAGLGQQLERLGARYIADVSPSGGRHIYVLFAAPLPWLELRDVARALALRFPAIDTAPMSSLGGQIAPPGARHKSGGWRVLSMPPEDASAAIEHPNGPEVWAALLTEFAAELRRAETAHNDPISAVIPAELDDTGVPWVPRLGGRAPLGAEADHVARTGRWNRTRYPGRSEARMAVLGACAARGWQLADVRAAVTSGAWKGLAALYERRSEPGRMERLLPYEWRKIIAGISREKNVRQWHTSDLSTRPPVDASASSAEYGLIRQWMTAIALRARGSRAGQRLGRPHDCCPLGAARARPGRDGQRLEHDRVRDT